MSSILDSALDAQRLSDILDNERAMGIPPFSESELVAADLSYLATQRLRSESRAQETAAMERAFSDRCCGWQL